MTLKVLRLAWFSIAGCAVTLLAQGPWRPPPLQLKPSITPAKQPGAATQVGAQLSGNTIPMWSYSVAGPSVSQTYSGVMVGRDPSYHGHRSTTIPAIVIPVKFTFTDGNVFDPTASDSCIGNNNVLALTTNSPLFKNSSFTMNGVDMGATQYVDAYQRANFWNQVSGMPYHTLLGLTVGATLTVPVTGSGNTFGCGHYATIDINSWDLLLQQTLIPQASAQGVGPTTLPIFLLTNVFLCDNTGCAAGYHNSYNSAALQTYVVATFDTTGATGGPDVSALSHEIAEWMDDPVGDNPTPSWGHVGQVTGCQTNLEVGDPLTHTFAPVVPLNGFTYHLQELAFFSWFYRQSPSTSAGGLYSSNGTFTTSAGTICQ